MDLEAIEQRAELTNRIRATIAKIDAKPWRGTDEERQQFEAEAIMRAHVGPELDALVARVRELEGENQKMRDTVARAGDFCERPTACRFLLNTARARDIELTHSGTVTDCVGGPCGCPEGAHE